MGSAPLSAASGGTSSLSAACTPLDSVDARRAHYLLERFAELPLQGEDAVLEPETHVAQPQRRALRFAELRREVSVGGGLGDVAEDEALPVDAHQDAAGACLSRDGGVVASLRRGLDGIRFHWSRQQTLVKINCFNLIALSVFTMKPSRPQQLTVQLDN